ncbi:MAG: hypothetical protein RL369_346 [Pseudomonadota bacterium]
MKATSVQAFGTQLAGAALAVRVISFFGAVLFLTK